MARLSQDERGRIAEKVMEWGNLVFAGSVIAQLVPKTQFSWLVALLGFVGIGTAYFVGYSVMKGGGR